MDEYSDILLYTHNYTQLKDVQSELDRLLKCTYCLIIQYTLFTTID